MKRISAVFLSILAVLMAMPAVVKAADPSTPGVVGTISFVSKTATSVSLNWSQPSDTGMFSIDDYLIQFKIAGGNWSTFADGVSTTTSASVTGLTRGGSYSFRIAAVNALGQGPFLEMQGLVVPATLPSAPSNVAISGTFDKSTYSAATRTITWMSPDDGGQQITDYLIEYSSDGVNWQRFEDGISSSTSATVTNLQRGMEWGFRISAVTAEGVGASSQFNWVKEVQTGADFACALTMAGLAYCWGANNFGQLGRGVAPSASLTPQIVPDLNNVVTLSVGPSHTCAVNSSGVLSCWGKNVGMIFGAAGPNYVTSPLEISSIGAVQSVSVGSSGTCVVKSNQKVYCIGFFGAVLTLNSFTEISGISDASNSISVGGNHACALTISGGVKCWGDNRSGQIGDGTTVNKSTATSVVGISNAKSISVTKIDSTGASCAALSTGAVHCWGSNGIGRFNSTSLGGSRTSPGSIGLLNSMSSVVMFDQSVCGLDAMGMGRCWGHNQYSALGDASYLYGASLSRNEISAERGVSITESLRSISTGEGFGCASTKLGAIWCWGNEAAGRLAFSGGGSRATDGWWPRIAGFVAAPVSSVIVTVPNITTSVSETAHSETSVSLNWEAPGDDGGSSVQDYVIQYSTGSTWTTFADGISTLTSTIVDGLIRGVNYQFRVAAVNSLGQGAYSAASGSSTPAVVPRAPLSLKVARWTGGYKTSSADLSWVSPDNGGQSVSDFNIEYRKSGDLVWSTFNDGVSTSTSVNVSGLTRAFSYEFRVRAVNTQGAGPWTYSSAESVSAGGSQACATQVNGQTKCWGANASGQLGDGTTTGKSVPTTMAETTRGVANAVGASHSCVLTALAVVFCVGSNSVGQLGDGSGQSSSSIVQVPGLTGVSKIAAGGSTTCALFNTGTVKCWGAGTAGQLGNGSFNDALTPVAVSGVSSATAITVGHTHSCALVASGGVQCWGNNASGQLGNSSTTDSSLAVSVTGLTGAVSISAGGSSTCAVLSNGTAKCWGSNASRQLGNASSVNSSIPVSVSGITTATKVVSGSSHSCLLLADSTVQCWGNNVSGQLGDGGTTTRDVPVVAQGVSSAIDIAAGSLFTCAIESTAGIDCWGAGGSGQLGDGLSTSSSSPVSVSGIAIVNTVIPVTGANAPTSLSETSHNDSQVVLSWITPSDDGGSSISDYKVEYKPFGGSWTVFNDAVSTLTTATVTGLTRGTKYVFRVSALNAIEVGDVSVLSVEITPSVVPGQLTSVQLLTFSSNSISVSWVVPSDDGGSPISDYRIEFKPAGGSWTVFVDGVSTSTLAVIGGLQQGALYSVRVSAMNANGAGTSLQLSGDVRPATSPSIVTNLQVDSYSSTAVQVSWTAGADGGEAISDYVIEYTTGTTWTTLNDGVSTNASAVISGISVGSYLRVRVKAVNSVGTGSAAYLWDEPLSNFDMSSHTCGVGQSGNVWCSGQNSSGQLGDGVTAAHYQFSRVNGISNATRVATGWDHSCAIVALGAVKCWGNNATGQLGDGTTTSSRRPVTVIGVSGAVEISAGRGSTCAVLNTGAAKCWGDNSQKQLGNNSAVLFASLPIDVPGISTASKIASAQYSVCLLLSDASVSCWGDNRYGQVGNGTFTSPDIAPGLVRTAISTNLAGAISLSSDPFADLFCVNTGTGRAWCWGTNNVYQRGVGTATSNAYASTPTGLTTSVQSIEVGGGHSCASVTGDIIKCWGYNVQGGSSGGASRTNVTVPTTVSGASGSKLLLGIYSSCSYSSASNLQCWGLNSSFERGDGGPDGGGPYVGEFNRQALLVADKPGSPTGLQVTSYSTSSVSLAWTVPSSTGGVPLYDYAIEVNDGSSGWTLINDGVGLSTSYTWNSAVKGSSYRFRVAAESVNRLGQYSSEVMASAVGNPSEVVDLSSPNHTSTSFSLTWSPPIDDGGSPVTDYIVEYKTAVASSWTTWSDGVSTNTSTTVTGLTRGTEYNVRVSARSANGDGTFAQMAGVVIPATTPAALSGLSISSPSGGGSLAVAYTAGDNGGRQIQMIWYRIDSGIWASQSCCSSPLVISGLTNGTSYSVELRVSNAEGYSPTSTAISATPAATPAAPTIATITRPVGGSQLSVAFTAGVDNGSTISGFEFSVNGGMTWAARTDGGGTSSPLLISSLVNGTSYQVKIRAVNAQGSGTGSSTVSAIPATSPGAPTITRLEPANGQLAIVLGTPSNNGGATVTNYEYSLDGGVNWSTRSPASTVSPWVITGLSNGTVYSVQLRAINVQGIGASSVAVFGTPASLPTAPTIVDITRPIAGQSLEVEFSAPSSNGGAALTTYQYSLNSGLTWVTRSDAQTTTSPLRISGLVNGSSYQIALRALNAQGSGIGSTVVAAIPAGVPTAPSISSIATPIAGETIAIAFSAAGANGAEVTAYQYSLDSGATWSNRDDGLSVESPIEVGSLTNGQAYNVRIRAINVQGQGSQSSSVSATPATTPDAPTITSLVAGESSFRITVRSNNTGGSAITTYSYSIDGGATWTSWAASAGTSKTVSAVVGTTYSVKTRVANRQGNSPASDATSVRVGDPPDAQTTGASDVTSTTAVLMGRVTANFAATNVVMEVSSQSDFSTDVRTISAGNVTGVSSSAVSARVVDLREATMYFYRVVASNALGRTVGATVSFETAAPVGVSIEDGADYTDSPKVLVNLSWPRSAMAVMLSNDGGFKKYTRISLAKTATWTLASTGNERLPKTIYVRYVMSDGSRSETFTDDIILDETDPTVGAVSAQRVAGSTVNALSLLMAVKPSVKLGIATSDANSGLDRVEIKGGGKTLKFVVSPKTKKVTITLTTSKTSIQVRSVDRAGNVSKWKTVKIPK